MLKKLSLALAFLGHPSVIMLDEPLITIDTKATEAMYELIKHYQQQTTFLLFSHQDFDVNALNIKHTYLVDHQTITQEN